MNKPAAKMAARSDDKSTNQGGQTNIQYQRAVQVEESVRNADVSADAAIKGERADLVQQERT